jgi:hypothetical protein
MVEAPRRRLTTMPINQRTSMKSTVAELRTPAHGLPRESHDVVGIVVALLPDDAVLVECDGARLRCLRAYSCLVAPEPGDRVVVSCADPQQR